MTLSIPPPSPHVHEYIKQMHREVLSRTYFIPSNRLITHTMPCAVLRALRSTRCGIHRPRPDHGRRDALYTRCLCARGVRPSAKQGTQHGIYLCTDGFGFSCGVAPREKGVAVDGVQGHRGTVASVQARGGILECVSGVFFATCVVGPVRVRCLLSWAWVLVPMFRALAPTPVLYRSTGHERVCWAAVPCSSSVLVFVFVFEEV